ncbi:MAG: hypothetical protein K6T17_05280 [Fimbriimonadales bacterium]|nr:hypothetical protein [Fimbriimonadales bacterium]
MKSAACVENRGIVSLKALFLAVVLGAVMGGAQALGVRMYVSLGKGHASL